MPFWKVSSTFTLTVFLSTRSITYLKQRVRLSLFGHLNRNLIERLNWYLSIEMKKCICILLLWLTFQTLPAGFVSILVRNAVHVKWYDTIRAPYYIICDTLSSVSTFFVASPAKSIPLRLKIEMFRKNRIILLGLNEVWRIHLWIRQIVCFKHRTCSSNTRWFTHNWKTSFELALFIRILPSWQWYIIIRIDKLLFTQIHFLSK